MFLMRVHGVCWHLFKSAPSTLDVEKSRQLKLPSPRGPMTPSARRKLDLKSVIGARQLASSCESKSPIKLKPAEESLREIGLKMPGEQERDGLGTPTQGEAHSGRGLRATLPDPTPVPQSRKPSLSAAFLSLAQQCKTG